MWRKLLFFCLMYFIQGAALAYVISFQKPFLVGRGVSKEAVGLFTGLLLLPFVFKIGLGWISDRWPLGRMGSRKPYMLGGLLLFGVCYGLLSGVDPGERFMHFALLSWLASFGLAWFDTCADGWAVDVAKADEQSRLQAAMIAGKSLGLILMSFAFGHLVLRHGFQAVFILLAALAVLMWLTICLVHFENVRTAERVSGIRDLLRGGFLFFAAFGVMYSVASFGNDGLLTLHLSEVFNLSPVQIGYFGMMRGAGALVGAVSYALLCPRIGRIRGQYLALLLLGAGCLLPLTPIPVDPRSVLWGVCWGFQETAYVTLAMQMSQGRWAATIFATAMIFSNAGTALGEAMAAPLVPQLGYEAVFFLFAVIAWLSIPLFACVARFLRA